LPIKYDNWKEGWSGVEWGGVELSEDFQGVKARTYSACRIHIHFNSGEQSYRGKNNNKGVIMDISSDHAIQMSPVSSSLTGMDVDTNLGGNSKEQIHSTTPPSPSASQKQIQTSAQSQAQAQIQTEMPKPKGKERPKSVAMNRLSVKALRTSSKRNFVSYDSEPINLSNATPEDTDPSSRNGNEDEARDNHAMMNKHNHYHQHHYRNVRNIVLSDDQQLHSDGNGNYHTNALRDDDDDDEDDNDNDNDSIAVGRRHTNLGRGAGGDMSAFEYDAPRDSQISLIREFADADTQDKSATAKGKRETRVQPNQDMFSVLQHAKSTPPKMCSSPSSEKALTSKDSQAHFGNLDGRCRGETGDLEGIVPLRNGRMGISNPPSRSSAEPTWLDLHRAKKRRGLQSLSLKNIIKLK